MPALIRLILVRHAEHELVGTTLVGRGDPCLSEAGRAQATALADGLAGERAQHLWTSPRTRCRETADAVALALRVTPKTTSDLDELDYGAWTGRSFSSLTEDPAWLAWNTARSTARPPSGETMQEAFGRAHHFIARLQPGTHILVTHAEIIRALVLTARGWPFDAWHRVEIAPASVTELAIRDGRLAELVPSPC